MPSLIVRQFALAGVAALTVVAAASFTRPIFLGRTTVAKRVLAPSASPLALVRPTWMRIPADLAVRTPQFDADRRAFVQDLLRTGRMSPARADMIARVAVTEAYKRKIPPALVLGVMLIENPDFKSRARSRVGATGLMQVMPRPWRSLRAKFGNDLTNDRVNVQYGVFILHAFGKEVDRALGPEASYRKMLLRYNGCVRGTNTPGCARYPDQVRRHVERSAQALCAGQSFDHCVTAPLHLAMRENFRAPDFRTFSLQRKPLGARPSVD